MFDNIFKKKTLVSAAEDMGYDCGWLGLENSNPYVVNTAYHKAYEWGYQQALDDIKEWESVTYMYEDEYMGYTI